MSHSNAAGWIAFFIMISSSPSGGFLAKHGIRPGSYPFLAMLSNLFRIHIGWLCGDLYVVAENLNQFGFLIDRENEHLRWHIFLKCWPEDEIDKGFCKLSVLCAFQDTNKFDLPKTGIWTDYRTCGCLCQFRFCEDDFSRWTASVRNDHRLWTFPRRTAEIGVISSLPIIYNHNTICSQIAPIIQVTLFSKMDNGCQQEC